MLGHSIDMHCICKDLLLAKKLLRLTLSGARLTVSERLVGNRVAPISGIKGSDSGGGPAPRHSIIYTAPFSSFHFCEAFC